METVATKRIEALYQVRDEADVWAFLDAHPFLVPLLLEAPAQIKTYFPESQLFLEMFIDPETVGVRSLVIFVATKLDVETALRNLDALDEGWWLKNMDRSQDELEINLESLQV